MGKCKECTKASSRQNHRDNLADPTRVHRYREMARDKIRRYRKLGIAPKYKPSDQLLKKQSANRYPEKYRARTLAGNAVRDNKLLKPLTCQHCGKFKKLQKHHADYSKPLDVIWLCTACHGVAHRKPIFPQDQTRKDRTT